MADLAPHLIQIQSLPSNDPTHVDSSLITFTAWKYKRLRNCCWAWHQDSVWPLGVNSTPDSKRRNSMFPTLCYFSKWYSTL